MSNPIQTNMPLEPPDPASSRLAALQASLRPKKTMRIAVSGGVLVTETERQILDTPDFQRLRGIRQLALAHLVYPTALHTRFDHSLGTLYWAARMVQSIRENAHNGETERSISTEQEVLIRLYALLHDVTHIPFGHTVEDELELLVRHDQNAERIQRFLGPDSDIGRIIVTAYGTEVLDKLHDIYVWGGDPGGRTFPAEDVFIHDLVSNTVCADLLDYLQRDDHFCNLGVPLEYHFVNFLYLANDQHSQRRVFVRLWKDDKTISGGRPRRDILTDLCRLLETRYLIAERVYFHHAKVAAGVMLGRAIQESLLAGEIDERFMWEMTDEVLLAQLRSSGSDLAQRLATEVSQRRLYKEYYAFGWQDVEKPQAQSHFANQYDDVIQIRLGSAERRREFEDQIADIIRAEPADVLIYAPTRKMNRKEAEANVFWEGHPTKLKDVSDPVVGPRLEATLEAHRMLWSIRILVRPSLTPAQRLFAKQLCEIELLTQAAERREKQEAIYAQIVERALAEENRRIPTSAQEFRRKVEGVVEELMAPGHLGEGFSKRLRAAIGRTFPDALA